MTVNPYADLKGNRNVGASRHCFVDKNVTFTSLQSSHPYLSSEVLSEGSGGLQPDWYSIIAIIETLVWTSSHFVYRDVSITVLSISWGILRNAASTLGVGRLLGATQYQIGGHKSEHYVIQYFQLN